MKNTDLDKVSLTFFKSHPANNSKLARGQNLEKNDFFVKKDSLNKHKF